MLQSIPWSANRVDDLDPIAAKERFTADQSDFPHTHTCELRHHVEAFRSSELPNPTCPSAGATVSAL